MIGNYYNLPDFIFLAVESGLKINFQWDNGLLLTPSLPEPNALTNQHPWWIFSTFRDNGPFPSYLVPLFQNESSCKTIHIKMSDLHENESVGGTHFDMNGLTQRLVSRPRHKVTRKWPIDSSWALKNVLCLTMYTSYVYVLGGWVTQPRVYTYIHPW